MATAEFAVALPGVVVVLLAGLLGLAHGIDQVRCVDAARLGARALARGDPVAASVAVARSAAPPGAIVAAGAGRDGLVTVTVVAHRAVPVLGLTWTAQARASAAREAVPP